MNQINTLIVKVDLSIHQINQIADALKEVRSGMDYRVERSDWKEYQKETVSRYSVQTAEDALAKRARLAAITMLTGETFDDSTDRANVAEGRALLDAQEAEAAQAELTEEVTS